MFSLRSIPVSSRSFGWAPVFKDPPHNQEQSLMAPSYRRLQQYAVAISVLSIIYNGAEGGVSIGLGSESASRSLVFFGVQSGIEVISAAIVVWRFWTFAMPGEESQVVLSTRDLRIEKLSSTCIGVLLYCLAISTEIVAIVGLAKQSKPDVSNVSLIISGSALVLMVLIWLPKRFLARALNSSAMAGEATCSLSCIQITIVLFIGSLVFRLWPGGWWVDSATSLVLGLLFGWEGYKLIKWARDPEFDGSCCKSCQPPAAQPNEPYFDLCDCCAEKSMCKEAGKCLCRSSDVETPSSCCVPQSVDGLLCCTHKVVEGTRLEKGSAISTNITTLNVQDNCFMVEMATEATSDVGALSSSQDIATTINLTPAEVQPVYSCEGCCSREAKCSV